MLGWSNGGRTLLVATDGNLAPVTKHFQQANERLRLAVAFYSGCLTEFRRCYRPVTDTWQLVGVADNLTPAAD